MEVKNVIIKPKKTKATAPDAIHNRRLTAAADIIFKPLMYLFNHYLTVSKFPSQQKIIQVTPNNVKKDQKNFANYPPTSLLGHAGKVLLLDVFPEMCSFL